MFKTRGKFDAWHELGNTVIYFKPHEIVENVWSLLWDYINKPIDISIAGYEFSGIIYRVRSYKRKIEIEITFTGKNDENIVDMLSWAGINGIQLTIKKNTNYYKFEEKISDALLGKLTKSVKLAAFQTGNSYSGLLKFLAKEWGHPGFHLSRNTSKNDALAFQEFLEEAEQIYELPFNVGWVDDTVRRHLNKCRRKNICVVCYKPSVVGKGSLYPVCEKHKKEFEQMGGREFEKCYALEEIR